MKKFKILLFTFIAVSSTLFVSCGGGTEVIGTWKNDQIHISKIKKILLIGVAKDPWIRKMFEGDLKKELSDYGVDAVSSLEIVSPDEKITKENFELYFGKENFDAVLVTRVVAENVSKTRVYNYTPSYGYYGFYGYYYSAYSYAYNPGYTVEETSVNLETNVYDIKSMQLAWSALSESFNVQKASDVIKPVIHMIVDEMQADGLIE
ncbi:MAG: hypothetical protein GXO85_00365 [Chlorobi bacterium]|nr:hypothetical protein [Chlorobiota bacterium]